MIALLIFFLITIALSQLWSHSKVFSFVRRFLVKVPLIRDILLCPVCASFWIALGFSFILNPFVGLLPFIVANISLGAINYAICGILYKNNILTDD